MSPADQEDDDDGVDIAANEIITRSGSFQRRLSEMEEIELACAEFVRSSRRLSSTASNSSLSSDPSATPRRSSRGFRSFRKYDSTRSKTIISALQRNAIEEPDHCLLTWVDEKCQITESLTYEELWKRSGVIVDVMAKKGIQRGDRVMIAYPFGLSFLAGFIACLRSGVIACSVYPPNPQRGKAKHSFEQFNNQVKDAGAKFALTTAKFKVVMVSAPFVFGQSTNVRWIATDMVKILKRRNKICSDETSFVSSDDIAFIQYSSGSTGVPKGVMISHGAILHNLRTIKAVSVKRGTADYPLDTMGVSWLPQYHDYGLFNFFLGPVYSPDFPSVNFSPIDFIKNPLLWADVLDKFNGTHTAGPNFSYGLLAKRMQAKKRTFEKSKLLRANIAAEPIEPYTLEVMEKIGVPKVAINPTYGMSECCVYLTSVLADEIKIVDGVASVGLLARSEYYGNRIVIADQERKVALDDGEVGEIYISTPSLSSGYWNKPELNEQCFNVDIGGNTYFATGDLGRIVDGRLYVVGRSKELIMINGRNVYPTDLERTIQNSYPGIVRPGSTAVYQLTSTDVGISLELRKDSVTDEELSSTELRTLIQNAHGVSIGHIYLLKKGTAPKTTSGKLRRCEIRRRSLEGSWLSNSIVSHWSKTGQQPIASAVQEEFEIPDDLPTDYLPEAAISAIMDIEVNTEKLDHYFNELNMTKLPGIIDAWNAAVKSTTAMQAMCEATMDALIRHHPSVVQFTHLLLSNPDWILEDGREVLVNILHCGFVLEWATQKLASDKDLLLSKFEADRLQEKLLLKDVKEVQIPKDARFLVGGKESDPLRGIMSTFHWMKHRSIDNIMVALVNTLHGKGEPGDSIEGEAGMDWATLNVLEATWLDRAFGRNDNISVGNWLSVRSSHTATLHENENLVNVHFSQEENWCRVYFAWNLALMTSFIDPHLVLSKLLMPCVANTSPDLFFNYRVISLYLTSQQRLYEHVQGESSSPRVLSESATRAFGALNKKWAFGLKFDPTIDWDCPDEQNPPEKPTGIWLTRFSKWDERRPNSARSESQTSSATSFNAILVNFFGDIYNSEQTWDELGLSSITSVELRGAIADNFSVTLSPDCFDRFPTPATLERHITASRGDILPTLLAKLPSIESKHLSWFAMGVFQAILIIFLLLVFAAGFIPAYYLGTVTSTVTTVEVINVNGQYAKWLWLPVAVPTWMFSFSLIVVIVKWTIIGRYKPCEMSVQSFAYLRWWWVDRAVHLWEQWVGHFFMGTPFLWMFYWLMGANIHPSVRIESFLRDFDLVRIEEGSWMKEASSIKCRFFSTSPALSLRFRPVHVGPRCFVSGMLCPGARVGEGSVVETRAVLVEGAQTPEKSILSGNPATSTPREYDEEELACWWKVYVLSLLWSVFTLYMMFGLNLVTQLLLNGRFPKSWRYSQLFYWVITIFLTALFILPVNVAMKWILIGRRVPGPFAESAWQVSCDWVVDFHYKVFYFITHVAWKSWWPFWNIVLRLYGMDIDQRSQIGFPYALRPSKVDLVHISKSYVSSADVKFETTQNGERFETELRESSISAMVAVGPGIKIINSVVPPTEYASQNMTGSVPQPPYSYSWKEQVEFYFLNFLWMTLVIFSFVPSYEFADWSFSSFSSAAAAACIAFPLVIHVLVSCLVLICFERVTFSGKEREAPRSIPLFDMCICASFAVQRSSFAPVLWGTPFWNLLLKLGGATVGERVLYFGSHQEGMAYQTLFDDTVVDGAFIIGHNAVGSSYSLGPAEASGVLHEGTFVFADTSTSKKETGPWRCCVQSRETTKQYLLSNDTYVAEEGSGSYDIEAQVRETTNQILFSKHTVASEDERSTCNDIEDQIHWA